MNWPNECWQEAVGRARKLGAKIVEIDFSPFQRAASLLYAGPYIAERYAAVGQFLESATSSTIDPTVRQIILQGAKYTALDLFRAEYELMSLRQRTARMMQTIDALLLPTAPTIYKISEVEKDPIRLNSQLGTYTNFVNLLDMAGIALPAGMRSDGLPFGITLLGPAFSDARLLQLGHWFSGTAQRRYFAGHQSETVRIAVVGAHLTGQPLNHQLTSRGARFVETTKTAPTYRLYALHSGIPRKPGLIRVREPLANGIEVEIWQLNKAAFGAFTEEIPPPLGIGTLELQDGTQVKGFVCEPYAVEGAEDITHLGGWRNYLKQSIS